LLYYRLSNMIDQVVLITVELGLMTIVGPGISVGRLMVAGTVIGSGVVRGVVRGGVVPSVVVVVVVVVVGDDVAVVVGVTGLRGEIVAAAAASTSSFNVGQKELIVNQVRSHMSCSK